jgi:hypothetical protein
LVLYRGTQAGVEVMWIGVEAESSTEDRHGLDKSILRMWIGGDCAVYVQIMVIVE